MHIVKALPEFTDWLNRVVDAGIRGVISARIKRLELGLMGDVEAIGDGVSELRIHVGAGWRIYFVAHLFRPAWRSVDCIACGRHETQSKRGH